MSWIATVDRFWFEELDPGDWFSARPDVDAKIRGRFTDLHAVLTREPPDAKQLSAKGHVAAVLVFDQFSRNLFRGSAKMYATDDIALALAIHAIDRGLDGALDSRHRQFLYMPLMHSEDREIQARSVQLFRTIGIPDALRFAEHHRKIIDRFGRFPHRNEILGRTTIGDERNAVD